MRLKLSILRRKILKPFQSTTDLPAGHQQSRRKRLIDFGVWGLLFAFLLFVTRYVFLQGDDFLHTSITDAAYGRFDRASWLHEWKIDLTLRNGRTADALSRLWLRPGIVGARIILSFVLLAFFYALYSVTQTTTRVNNSPRESVGTDLTIFLSVLTMFALILFTDDQFYGNVIAWLSGSANYLLPTVLVLLGLIPSLAFIAGRNVGTLSFVTGTFFLLLGQISHEQHELAVIAYWVLFIVMSFRKVFPLPNLRMKLHIALSIIVATVHLAAPGIWIRMDVVDSMALEMSRGARYLLNFATGSQGFIWLQRYQLLLLVPVLLFIIWRSARLDRKRWVKTLETALVIAIFGGNLLLAFLRRRYYMHNMMGGLNVLPDTIVYLIALCSVLGVVALAGIVFHLLLRDDNPVLQGASLWIAMIIGNSGILLLIGSLNARSFFPGTVYLGAMILQLLFDLLQESRSTDSTALKLKASTRRVVAIIAVVVCVLFTGYVYGETARRARANSLVWAPIEQELIASLETQPDSIMVKDSSVYPYPDSMYFRAFFLRPVGYEEAIRHYYNVPSGTELVQVDSR